MSLRTKTGGISTDGAIAEGSYSGLQVTDPFFCSFFVRIGAFDNTNRAISCYDDANSGWGLFPFNDGGGNGFKFFVRHSLPRGGPTWSVQTWQPAPNGPTIQTDTWYHHLIGFSSSGVWVWWHDGTDHFLFPPIRSGTIQYATTTFQVGRYWDGIIKGHIAEFAIWDGGDMDNQLSADTLRFGPSGTALKINSSNLLAYWPLDRYPTGIATVDGDIMHDKSGSGYDLTVRHETDARGSGSTAGEGGGVHIQRPGWPMSWMVGPAAAAVTRTLTATGAGL